MQLLSFFEAFGKSKKRVERMGDLSHELRMLMKHFFIFRYLATIISVGQRCSGNYCHILELLAKVRKG